MKGQWHLSVAELAETGPVAGQPVASWPADADLVGLYMEVNLGCVTVTRVCVYTTEGNRCNHKIMGELCVWSSFGHT